MGNMCQIVPTPKSIIYTTQHPMVLQLHVRMVLQLNIGEAQERADGERLQVLMHISTWAVAVIH